MVRGRKETLFYTGDVCFHDQTILRGARFEDVKADVLHHGNDARQPRSSRPASRARPKSSASARPSSACSTRRGSVLIPAFALGRTQEILALLAILMGEGKLKPAAHPYRRPGPRVHGNLRPGIPPHPSPASQPAIARGPESRRAGSAAGREDEVCRRPPLRHHRRHDEREHRLPQPGPAHDRRRTPRHLLRRLRRPRHAGRPPQSLQAGRDLSSSAPAPARSPAAAKWRTSISPPTPTARTCWTSSAKSSRAWSCSATARRIRAHWFAGQIHARYPKIKIIQPKPGEAVEV